MTLDKWAMIAIALLGVIASVSAQVLVAARRYGADAQTMKQQGEQLVDHSDMLRDHGRALTEHGAKIAHIEGRLEARHGGH